MRAVIFSLLVLLSFAGDDRTPISFQDVTRTAGLEHALAGMMGHAAAWGDVDNDGSPDLFVAGFCDRPASEYAPSKGPVPARLFRNLKSGKFEVIDNPQVNSCGRSAAALFADLNNDRLPELLVSNNSLNDSTDRIASVRSKFYKNQKGKLIDFSEGSGMLAKDISRVRNIAVFDFNSDRLLDILLIQDKLRKTKAESSSVLLKNAGGLKFVEATAEAGLPQNLFGLGVAVADLNDDRKPDLFITHSNRLFLTTSENRYREATEFGQIFQWDPSDSEDWPSGAAFGDLNRDGRMDLVITAHHDPARHRVYINRGLKKGIPAFEDVTAAVGLSAVVPTKSPHVEIQDFDNDGWMDIYVSAAWKLENRVIPVIYRNKGVQKNGLPVFETERAIKPPMIYFPSGPTSDFNLDGKMDLLLVNWFRGETSHLLMNQTKTGNWIQIKAHVGSAIRLRSRGTLIGYGQVYPGYGFASGQEPVLHFGVGKLQKIDLEVMLPDGRTKQSRNVSVNRRMEFR